jgi:hypothetical protein
MKASAFLIAIVAALGLTAEGAGAYSFLGDRWLDGTMPVPYYISGRNENCIAGSEEFDEIRIAFQTWQNVPGVRLTFVDAGMTTSCGHAADGKSTMSMEDCENEISGGVIASTSTINWGGTTGAAGGDYTWVGVGTANEAQRAGLKESDIVFGDGWRFGTHEDVVNGCCTDSCGCSNSIDLRSIAVHEMGHLVGLGHSNVPGSTMFATYNICDTEMASLEADDIAGLTILYDEDYVPTDFEDLDAGNVKTSLLNAGNVGVSGTDDGLPGAYGSGFQWPGTTQNLFEAALIFGTGPTNPASNDIRINGWGQDNDFYQLDVVSRSTGGVSDQVAYTTFTDEQAESPYGIRVSPAMHAFAEAPNDDIIILCYRLVNASGSAINGLRVGFWADWNFAGRRLTNSVTYDAVNGLGIVSDAQTNRVLGMTVLNAEGVQTFRAMLATDAADYSTAAKRQWLFDDFTHTSESANNIAMLIATGDFNLAPGGSANAAFAFVVGESVAELVAKAEQAQALFDSDDYCTVGVIAADDLAVPGALRLGQNVPNPFNPATRIRFDLDRAGMVSLRIFDATGRLARTLVEGVRLAGEHEFTWDGADDRGRDLPSGMYFYTLEAGGERITRRMVLLK